jgi:hypothetical protein
MDKPVSESTKAMPLRFVKPEYYRMLLRELEVYHLHPFDVHASAIAAEDELTIVIRYGDRAVWKCQSLLGEDANAAEGAIADFFRETAEDCKNTLIADYYKMMKV